MTVSGDDFSSFGALLRAFRLCRHLTQQVVADALGIHRRTLVRWEQGDYLPESKTMVLELARCLKLDGQEARQLLEASLTALAPYWLVPLPRNPYFTGREEILETLHRQLGVGQTVALTQSLALHGLGGIGKTQIALEYAYRHALEYSAVFWIEAETEATIVSSLLQVASVLQVPGRSDQDQQRALAAVQCWLSTHGQWLLIWDNVEDLDLLSRFLPVTRSGAILLTTRHQALGPLARGLDLVPMEREEGVLFLLRRAKVLEPEATSAHLRQFAAQMPAQSQAAEALVEELGGLPLALDQAGAYLEETCCGLPAYLDLFYTRRAILLQQRGEESHDHPASVSTTFTLAITAIAERHPAVRDLLAVCARLQADAIPEELFRQGSEHLGPQLQAVSGDTLKWDRVVGVACSYSLLSRQPDEQTLSMHRLVQAVLLDGMTEAEHAQWSKCVIDALDAVFPEIRPATECTVWKQAERLLPHTLFCLQQVAAQEPSLPLASLTYKAAQYLRERSRYAEAEPLYQSARSIREKLLGPGHPEVATLLNYVAAIYYEQGAYTEAEPLLQRVIRIREQALGPEHPEVARALNNLGELSRIQGQYPEAEPLLQRVLHSWEQRLGPQHPLTATALDNLADLFRAQGKYTEAEPLYRRALHIWEQARGPEHHDVALGLNDLANLFLDQGKYPEAEPLLQRALHIWEQQLGPEHPHVAHPLNGLANLLREQRQYVQAEALYQRALSLRERQLGSRHPDTAETLHDFALLRQKQGKLSEAISLAERALSIRSQSLGEAHPKTVATRTLLAQLHQEQAGRQNEAPDERSAQEASYNLF